MLIYHCRLTLISDSVPIHYGSVQCTGYEDRLSQCAHSVVSEQCNHYDDVIVFCAGTVADLVFYVVNNTKPTY